jgi:hypothetical protein
MRTLIIVPIIHAENDMGSLRDAVRQAYIARFGADSWEAHQQAIAEVWRGIARMLDALALPYARVRLYQDGLPVCGREMDIVSEVAGRGSANHRLLLDLIGRGASLVGTEDPQLLLRELRRLQAAPAGPDDPGQLERWQIEGQALLAERDDFIARRIDATLAPGEIGLLFLGLAHAIEPRLPTDILTRNLLPAVRGRGTGTA